MIRFPRIMAGLLGLLVAWGPVLNAEASTVYELKNNFKKRYPAVIALKREGKIGETSTGTLEAVRPKFMKDPRVRKIMNAENADRETLYALMAQEQKTTPRVVARRNAKRNFSKARAGEFLKQNGKWLRKQMPVVRDRGIKVPE